MGVKRKIKVGRRVEVDPAPAPDRCGPPMPEQRVERPADPPTDESFRASWKRWRAYALQLERDNAALTAEVGRLRALLRVEVSNARATGAVRKAQHLEAALTMPADQPAPATKPLSSVEEVRDALGIPESPVCRHCKGTGRAPSEWLRVPAPEDEREDRLVPGYDISDPHEEGNR